jgi:hypothetical protein
MVKKIQLSQGRWTWVDDEDFERVNQYNWSYSNMSGNQYALRSVTKDDGKRTSQLLHRFIMGEENIPKGMLIDHKDGDGLDNRRSNLRVATHTQNIINTKRPRKDIKSSKYKGVHWDKERNKWASHVVVNKKRIYLGRFDSEKEAGLAYDIASEKHHGEFASNNGLMKKSP